MTVILHGSSHISVRCRDYSSSTATAKRGTPMSAERWGSPRPTTRTTWPRSGPAPGPRRSRCRTPLRHSLFVVGSSHGARRARLGLIGSPPAHPKLTPPPYFGAIERGGGVVCMSGTEVRPVIRMLHHINAHLIATVVQLQAVSHPVRQTALRASTRPPERAHRPDNQFELVDRLVNVTRGDPEVCASSLGLSC